MKPLITSMSIVLLSASMSVSALAAPNNNTNVKTADKLPGIAVLASLDVQENRSRSIDGNNSVATPKIKTNTTDSMGQLIDDKKDNQKKTAAKSVTADNMSAAELTRKDEQSDRTDDISEGQAVANPNGALSDNAADSLTFA